MNRQLRHLLPIIALCAGAALSEETSIVVHADKLKGKVVRDIFGSEIKCFQGGQGLMTGLRSAKNDFRAEVMDPIEKLQPEFMRYKFLRNNWTWEDGIGPMSGRKDDKARQKFMGIDEAMAFQMRVVKDAGRCQLVVNPCDPEQCAALVAYLNVPADDPEKNRHSQVIGVSKNNGRDYKTIGYWAKLRAENGHPQPYGCKWFELGNESYQEFPKADAHAYCKSARDVAKAMKAVDPSVHCGVNTEAYPTKQQNWRPALFKEGLDFPDFIVCHAYYPFAYPRNSKYVSSVSNMDKTKVEELYYKMIMAGAQQCLSDLRWFRNEMKANSSRAEQIDLCLTENGFHLEVYDDKAQNTVLVGVYDTDLIGTMVEYADELKIKDGNLFYLESDDPWALIHHHFENGDSSRVNLRPPYYALYLWRHYFGDSLLQSEVKCGTFDIPLAKGDDWPKEKQLWTQIAAQDGIPLVTAHSSLSPDGKTLYLMVVNRDLYNDIESNIDVKGFSPQPGGEVHTLNTSVTAASKKTEDMFAVWDSNNEDTADTVKIRDSAISNAGAAFKYTFPAHSATAIVLKAK
jgi:alpha-N-arabinofuranosidase